MTGDYDLENGFFRESFKYERRVHRVFTSHGDKGNSFVPAYGGGEECSGLFVLKILILLPISVTESTESHE